MPEPFDVYADQFQLNLGPYGALLAFGLTSRQPVLQGQAIPTDHQGTVRMSNEHLKVLAFLCRRQLMQIERAAGVSYPVPTEILNQLGISLEDWEGFWRQG